MMRLHAGLLPLGCFRSHGRRRGWVIPSSIDLAAVTILHADGWCAWSSTPAGEPSWATPRTIGSESFHPHPMPRRSVFASVYLHMFRFGSAFGPREGALGIQWYASPPGDGCFATELRVIFCRFFRKNVSFTARRIPPISKLFQRALNGDSNKMHPKSYKWRKSWDALHTVRMG